MRKAIFFVLSAIILASCNSDLKVSGNTPEETWETVQDYMAPGATVSSERPINGILSEQEVLLRATEYASKKGMLHPSYHVYEDQPELLTAKIEAPVLIYNFTGYPNDDGGCIYLPL
jgi:uncharacterized protein YcfL